MNENKKNSLESIPEKHLEDVTAGFGIITYKPHPHVVTQNNSRYSSGDTPKYSVGQKVWIMAEFEGSSYRLACEILSVSSAADRGWICKEFGYRIMITDSYFDYVKNAVYDDVYESCLYA